MPRNTLIIVQGPTAIGKTALAIKLAGHYATDIVSADSRQFFKEMQIGTAVPNDWELQAAQHHLIQHISIHTPYSVGDFEREALQILQCIFKRRNLAILAGGSGLYVDALCNGLDKFPEIPKEVREGLISEFKNGGIAVLQSKLKNLDPSYYKKVDLYNAHRLIRALEVCIVSGKPYSSFLNKPPIKRDFQIIRIGLMADREVLYKRINKRVEVMMEQGLLEEAKNLLPYKHVNALQTVGYRELFDYLEKTISLETAVSEIKKNTRRYAKRQLTWLRKNPDITWFDWQYELKEIIHHIDTRLKA